MAYELTYISLKNNTVYEVTGYTGTPTDVVIPSEYDGKPVTSIGDNAFNYCTSLTSVVIGDRVTSIGNYAFQDCGRLTSVLIPDSVTSIGNYAFSSCDSLTSVLIPDSVTSIGNYAFSNCMSLQYNIQDNLLYLGNNNNPYLYLSSARLTVTEVIIDNNCKLIGASAFRNCDKLTSVVIGDSVTSIGDNAFGACSALTSVVLGDSVTSIGQYAFQYCSSLTSMVIPDSVTSIDPWAFQSCTSLTSVEIGDSVTRIEWGAFQDCSKLESIILFSKNPPLLTNNSVFSNLPANARFYCYSASLGNYKTASNWNFFASKFIADDLRLYFIMSSRAQKKYFATIERVVVLEQRVTELERIKDLHTDRLLKLEKAAGFYEGGTLV